MKNFLRGGRGMAFGQSDKDLSDCLSKESKRLVRQFFPRKGERKDYVSRQIVLIIPMIIFCVLFSNAFAQSAVERTAVKAQQEGTALKIKRLEVGDTLPEEFWTTNVQIFSNGKLENTTLAKYRGKPFLIDFWNTHCTTCIARMPKLYNSELYKSGTMDILLVTPEDGQLIKKFSEKNTKFNSLPTTSLVSNKWVADFFFHRSVPYYVLIGSQGLVQAAVGSEEMDLEMLSGLIKNPTKTFTSELTTDFRQWPKLLASRYSDPAIYHYSFFAEGENLKYGRASLKRYDKEKLYSISSLNVSYWTLFNTLASVHYSEIEYPFHHTFVLFQDSIQISPSAICTFEIALPKGSSKNVVEQSIAELNMRLDANIHFEDREIDFWEIYEIKKDEYDIDWGEIGEFSILATDLITFFPDQPLFIDVSKVNISIPTNLKEKNVDDLQKWLHLNHLSIRKKKKIFPILIVE